MENINFDIWSILFLIAGVQGLFLSVMIFVRRLSANHLLGALILSFSLMLLYYVAFWTRLDKILPWYFGMAQGFTLLLGPLAYFYLKSKLKVAPSDLWHLLPYSIFVTNYIMISFIESPIRNIFSLAQVLLQIGSLGTYAYLCFRLLRKSSNLTNGRLKRWRWHYKIAWAFTGYVLSFIVYYILVWTRTIQVEYDYMVSGASSFFIYFIGYYSFQKPEVLRMNETPRYDKSSLNATASMAILKEIKNYFDTEHPYLNSELKQSDLSQRLNYSVHQVSQVINELEGKSFTDFVNEYRIEKAKTLLAESRATKIIHVAYDCGFNNKTSFNNAFKKFTGVSPGEYRESQSVPA